MKKLLIITLSAILIITLVSCLGSDEGVDTTDGSDKTNITETTDTETLVETEEPETTRDPRFDENGETLYLESDDGRISYIDPDPYEKGVFEIELPKNGERIEYDGGLMLFFDDESGKTLVVTAAERVDDFIFFYCDKSDYYFFAYINILTSDGEVFLSLNAEHLKDGSVRYKTDLYDGENPWSAENIKSYLGDSYDETKNYYYISGFTIYDMNGNEISQNI